MTESMTSRELLVRLRRNAGVHVAPPRSGFVSSLSTLRMMASASSTACTAVRGGKKSDAHVSCVHVWPCLSCLSGLGLPYYIHIYYIGTCISMYSMHSMCVLLLLTYEVVVWRSLFLLLQLFLQTLLSLLQLNGHLHSHRVMYMYMCSMCHYTRLGILQHECMLC